MDKRASRSSPAAAIGPGLMPMHGGQFEYQIPRTYKLQFRETKKDRPEGYFDELVPTKVRWFVDKHKRIYFPWPEVALLLSKRPNTVARALAQLNLQCNATMMIKEWSIEKNKPTLQTMQALTRSGMTQMFKNAAALNDRGRKRGNWPGVDELREAVTAKWLPYLDTLLAAPETDSVFAYKFAKYTQQIRSQPDALVVPQRTASRMKKPRKRRRRRNDDEAENERNGEDDDDDHNDESESDDCKSHSKAASSSSSLSSASSSSSSNSDNDTITDTINQTNDRRQRPASTNGTPKRPSLTTAAPPVAAVSPSNSCVAPTRRNTKVVSSSHAAKASSSSSASTRKRKTVASASSPVSLSSIHSTTDEVDADPFGNCSSICSSVYAVPSSLTPLTEGMIPRVTYYSQPTAFTPDGAATQAWSGTKLSAPTAATNGGYYGAAQPSTHDPFTHALTNVANVAWLKALATVHMNPNLSSPSMTTSTNQQQTPATTIVPTTTLPQKLVADPGASTVPQMIGEHVPSLLAGHGIFDGLNIIHYPSSASLSSLSKPSFTPFVPSSSTTSSTSSSVTPSTPSLLSSSSTSSSTTDVLMTNQRFEQLVSSTIINTSMTIENIHRHHHHHHCHHQHHLHQYHYHHYHG